MERQAHYANHNASSYADHNANPYADHNVNHHAAAQLQQIALQRMQQNAGVGRFQGRPNSRGPGNEQINMPSPAEGTWDQKPAKAAAPISSHPYKEGQANYASQSFYDGPMSGSQVDAGKFSNSESRLQNHEQDMEIGYDDKPSAPTLEGLERRFIDEIMQLAKEQCDAEDAENARHREKLIEINSQHQEKLSSLRARQARRREEFLLMEAQTRINQHHQAGLNLSPVSPRPLDSRVYGRAATVEAHQAVETHHVYPSAEFETHGDRTPIGGVGRNQGNGERVPVPMGRVYNNTSSQYYR